VLAALLAVAISGPSSGDDTLVAKVGETPVTVARFDHWLAVAVRSSTRPHHRAVVPAVGTTRWRVFRTQVMQFLLSAEWMHGEAKLQGITVTHAQVLREFRKTRDESFPRRRDYRKFLRESGMTQDDLLYRVELDMLSERLRRKVTRPYKTSEGQQRALDRFVKDFRARWIAQTSCAELYKTSDCSQTLPAPG